MSRKINLVFVGGIRPHYIKLFAFQSIFKRLPDTLKEKFDIIYINAAQHYDYSLSAMFTEDLNIHFDYTLVHSKSDTNSIYGSILERLCALFDELMEINQIDYVVVIGDVVTTAIASLCAKIKHLKLIHLEAGSWSRNNANIQGIEVYLRSVANILADYCFTSTKEDLTGLSSECQFARSYFTGDLIYDFIKRNKDNICQRNTFSYYLNGSLNSFNCNDKFVLLSIHHSENLSARSLNNFFKSVKSVRHKKLFIAHPKVLSLLDEYNINIDSDTIIVEGIPFLDNLTAICNSEYVVTDSSGIQREAFYFNKRCLVCSELLVWQTIIDLGSNLKVGCTTAEISDGLIWAEEHKNDIIQNSHLFGEGNSVELILNTISNHYEER